MVTEMPLLLPKPSWVSYEPQAKILKKDVNWIDTSKNTNWHLSANALRDYCKNNKYKYQLLILNSPNNPTGTNNEELEELSKICKEEKPKWQFIAYIQAGASEYKETPENTCDR